MKVYLRETSAQSIKERKKWWYVSFYVDGKRYQKKTGLPQSTGKREVEKRGIEIYNQTLEELREGVAGRDTLNATIKECLDEYERHLTGKGSNWAVSSYFSRLLSDKKFKFGEAYLAKNVTQRDIDRLVLARIEAGYSAQTIRHEITVLRAAMTRMGIEFPRLRRKTLPIPKVKTRAVTVAEYLQVLDYIDNKKTKTFNFGVVAARPDVEVKALEEIKDICTFLLFTGARWGEMCNVRWSDVHFAVNAVRLGTLKKEAGFLARNIGMADRLLDMMKRRWNAVKDIEGALKRPVFPKQDGITARDDTSAAFIKVLDGAGLNGDGDTVKRHGRAGAHSFRHGFATLAIQQGMDLVSVSTLLGHSSLAMTQRYINHELGLVVTRIGLALSGVVAPDVDKSEVPVREAV